MSEQVHTYSNVKIFAEQQRPSDTLTKPVNTLLLLVLFITMVDA